MGENERRLLLGTLFESHQKANQFLACLRAQANRMQQAMQERAQAIRGVMSGQDAPEKLSPPPADEVVEKVLQQIAEVREQIVSTETELRDMGYGDYLNR